MKLRRILILVGAAALGSLYYNHYKAANNLMKPGATQGQSGYVRQTAAPRNQPIGRVGGVGKVGNPYDDKN